MTRLRDLEAEMARPLRAGDRVRARRSGALGTVVRVVTGRTAGSRWVEVRWDAGGSIGQHTRAALIKEG